MAKVENILDNAVALYVEDEGNTRESMTKMLKRFFKEVYAEENGERALKRYKELLDNESKIDIIITDINMPVMNGIDMIKHIREIDYDIPIVLITAHSEANYLLEAINLNVSHYVIKPVNAMLLYENMQKAYLPIHQKILLEKKNQELILLNEKIKRVAKEELENMRYGDMYLSSDDIDFGEFLDNITLDN